MTLTEPKRVKIEQPNSRPLLVVADDNGAPVMQGNFFLGWHSSTRRYFVGRSNPRYYLGRDRIEAIRRFRAWASRDRKERMDLPEQRPKLRWLLPDPPNPDPEENIYHHKIPAEVFWEKVRSEFLDNPRNFAEKTGIPEFAYLFNLKKPTPSITLSEVADLFFGRPNPVTPKTERDARKYWQEFQQAVKVETVAEVTSDHVNEYHEKIFAEFHKGKSPTYVRMRFAVIKSLLNYSLKRGKDPENVQRLLTLCKMLVPPQSNGVNPKDLAPADFQALLTAADTKWKAILLLALNAAYYPIDIANVTKESIDLDGKTLRDFRTKTGVPRIAVLWDRTVTAIREYLKEQPHNAPTLFVSKTGAPLDPNHIGYNFRSLRKRAKVSDSVEFAHIRDGAQTAAVEGGADPVRVDMLLGHRTGIRDNYLLRKPSMVADACAAIEARYFSKATKKRGNRKP